MATQYTHLSYEERVAIRVLRKQGKGLREVSRELGRAPSTVSRELRRNEQFAGTRVIYPHFAQMKANGRRRRSYRKPRLKTMDLQRYVVKRLEMGWSPLVIAGRMKREKRKHSVSHEAIYQFIYAKRPDLRDCLARHHMQRKRFRQSKKFKIKVPIPGRISISERPARIAARKEFGHWEGDLIVSRHDSPSVQVLLERRSRRVLLHKIKDRTAASVRKAIVARLGKFNSRCLKTITYDNGKENAQHQQINSALGIRSYFTDTYAAWQKGSVENVIGIVRRTYPKATKFVNVSFQELKLLERKLNSTPRKCLQFRTPMEVFTELGVALHS